MLPGWSTVPLATLPLAALPAGAGASIADPFATLLSDPDAEYVFVLVATPLPLVDGTVYIATEALHTEAGETPASQGFPPYLRQPFNFETRIPFPGTGDGLGSVAAGVIELDNPDGALDALLDREWSGQPLQIFAGGVYHKGRADEQTLTWSEYRPVLEGVAQRISADDEGIRIELKNPFLALDVPLQPNLYAGTGGNEGDATIAGQEKPLAYGPVTNFPGVIVDPVELIVQFHDGSLEGYDALRDNGVPLTILGDISDGSPPATALRSTDPGGWTKVPGEAVTDRANGLAVVGAPPAGRLTADFRGDNSGGYVTTLGAIVRRIVTAQGGLDDPEGIDPASFARVDLGLPGSVAAGYPAGTSTTVGEAVKQLMGRHDGFATFLRSGLFAVGLHPTPEAATPEETTADPMAIEGTVEELSVPPRAWRVRLGYAPLGVVQSADELAGAVSAADRARYSTARLLTTEKDAAVLAENPQARDLELETHLTEEADAASLRAAVFARESIRRRGFREVLKRRLFQHRPGQVVRVGIPELGIVTPKPLLILSVAEDGDDREVTLELWG